MYKAQKFTEFAFLAAAAATASSTYQDPVFTGPSISAFYSELHSIDSKYNMESAWEAFATRDVLDTSYLELWYNFYWETYMYDVESLQLKYTGVEELSFSMDPEYNTWDSSVVASLQAEDERLHESIRNALQGSAPIAATLNVESDFLVETVSILAVEYPSFLDLGYPSFLDLENASFLEVESVSLELGLGSDVSALDKSLAAKLAGKLANLKLSSVLGSSASSESTTNGIAGTWAGPYLAGGVVGMVALALL